MLESPNQVSGSPRAIPSLITFTHAARVHFCTWRLPSLVPRRWVLFRISLSNPARRFNRLNCFFHSPGCMWMNSFRRLIRSLPPRIVERKSVLLKSNSATSFLSNLRSQFDSPGVDNFAGEFIVARLHRISFSIRCALLLEPKHCPSELLTIVFFSLNSRMLDSRT